MALRLAGKTAIVTGAGSGISLAFARLLLAKRCNVVVADLALRPEARALVLDHSSHSSSSARAIFQKTDVKEWSQLQRMFKTAIKEFGDVDIVCPGAGVYEPAFSSFWYPPGLKPSRDKKSSSRYASIDIDLVHPIRTTQLALSHFLSPSPSSSKEKVSKKSQSTASPSPKSIIHISSVAAQVTPLWAPLYIASKHGLSGFVRTLAPLSQPDINVRVTAVAPRVIDTPLWRENPDKLRLIDVGKGDVWTTADAVAETMAKLVEEDEVLAYVKGEEARIPVEGGLILEVGQQVRKVEQFGDEGPSGKGHSAGNADTLNQELLQRLSRG